MFLASASTLTILILLNPEPKDTATNTSQQTCQPDGPQEKLDVPEAYIPEGPVTELQATDLTEGSGPAAKNGDCLVMKYYGTLASDGTKFDEDFTNSTGFAFTLGKGEVVQGWDQGLVGMKAGGMRRLVIPAALGYGDQANGRIPANSDLVFVVKLEKIQEQ